MSKNLLCLDFRSRLVSDATIDVNLWQQSNFAVDDLTKKYGDKEFLCEWPVSVNFYEKVPVSWILGSVESYYSINAYFLHSEEMNSVFDMYGFEVKSDSEEYKSISKGILSNWISLGFDICTPDLAVSAIKSTNEMDFAKFQYSDSWNEYGLLKNRDSCLKIIKDYGFNPHDAVGFIPVEIYVKTVFDFFGKIYSNTCHA